MKAWLAGAMIMASLPASAGVLPERVEKAARERIAAGTNQTLVFGVIDGDRSEIVAFGTLPGGRTPDGDTVYEIGSVTKTFTGTLLARAVLAGRVTLDTPVARVLPDFRIPSRNGREITLADLATHRSGLPQLPLNLLPKPGANPYADYDTARLKEFLAHYVLPRDPGGAFEYPDVGFGLLGHAMAALERASYATAIDEVFLKPLGMATSGTASTEALRAGLVAGHDSADKSAIAWDIPGLAGTGAIRSTARDMLRYLRANMGRDASPLAAAMKLAHQPINAMDARTRMGLGWRISDSGVVWHSGMTWGFRSFVGFTADGSRGVVILSNTAADVDDLGFATLLPDTPLRSAMKAVVLPAASLDAYEGTYKLTDNFLLTVFRMNDELFVRPTGQQPFPILASATDEFFGKAWGLTINFTRDRSGAVNGLVLHQNGHRAARRLSASELPTEQQEIALDAASLGGYVGRYRGAFGMLEIALRAGGLQAQITGQSAVPIYARARDQFFYKFVDAQLDFERDSQGKVTAVTLHQNGGRARALRAD